MAEGEAEIISDREFIREMRQVSYFGFSANQFVEEFHEMFKSSLKDCLDAYEEAYFARLGENPEAQERFKELYSNFLADFTEKSLNRIRETAEEVFTIPENLIVPGYDDIEPVTDVELEKLNEEVSVLEKEYIREKVYLEILRKKNAELEALEPLVEHNAELIKQLEVKKGEIVELKKCVKVSTESYEDASNEFKNDFVVNILCRDSKY